MVMGLRHFASSPPATRGDRTNCYHVPRSNGFEKEWSQAHHTNGYCVVLVDSWKLRKLDSIILDSTWGENGANVTTLHPVRSVRGDNLE